MGAFPFDSTGCKCNMILERGELNLLRLGVGYEQDHQSSALQRHVWLAACCPCSPRMLTSVLSLLVLSFMEHMSRSSVYHQNCCTGPTP